MRTAVDFSTARKENYIDFCKKNSNIKLSIEEWRNIIYSFSESYRNYILETGYRARLPFGFGEFTITKKKRRKIVTDPNGIEHINLPIDWKRTKEKGKYIYNFNYHTEGFFFGWKWFKNTTRLLHSDFWYFKPSRITSRMITHYLKLDPKNQFRYSEWANIK